MKRAWLVAGAAGAMTLAACQARETPRPAPAGAARRVRSPERVAVSLAQRLAEGLFASGDPSASEGAFSQARSEARALGVELPPAPPLPQRVAPVRHAPVDRLAAKREQVSHGLAATRSLKAQINARAGARAAACFRLAMLAEVVPNALALGALSDETMRVLESEAHTCAAGVPLEPFLAAARDKKVALKDLARMAESFNAELERSL